MVEMRTICVIVILCHLIRIIISAELQKTSNVNVTDDKLFPISIIHINDVHARFEETNELSSACKIGEKCIGGYGRAVTKIKELMGTHQQLQQNPIYLNAGDSFQGTAWYTFGRWNVTSEMFNLLSADAIAIGNHDFHHGILGLLPFLDALNSSVIIANIDDADEPVIQNKYTKSIVVNRYARKIGIIGVILQSVDKIADTGKLRFINESDAIRDEAIELKRQGVDIIIVLSHCGLDIDYEIAKNAGTYIDVIVGGHSHTFMYTKKPNEREPPGPDEVHDDYPAVVESDEGHRVLIVQASAYLNYVGDLTVFFDENGEIVRWQGAPHFLDTNIVPDADVVKAMEPWKKWIDEQGSQSIARTEVPLLKIPCHSEECNLGNLITDAFVDYYLKRTKWNKMDALIGLITCGTIHSSINAGDHITYNDLLMILPFNNSLDIFELRGDYLKDVFEHAVSESWNSDQFVGKWLMQISGARVTFNMSKSINDRVNSIEYFDRETATYRPINFKDYYSCVAQNHLVNGGNKYDMIKNNKRNWYKGPNDIDIVLNYLQHQQVIRNRLENRLVFLSR